MNFTIFATINVFTFEILNINLAHFAEEKKQKELNKIFF